MGFIINTLHTLKTLWQQVWGGVLLTLIAHFLFLLVSLSVLTPTSLAGLKVTIVFACQSAKKKKESSSAIWSCLSVSSFQLYKIILQIPNLNTYLYLKWNWLRSVYKKAANALWTESLQKGHLLSVNGCSRVDHASCASQSRRGTQQECHRNICMLKCTVKKTNAPSLAEQTEIFTPARHWPWPGPSNNC